MVGLKHDVELGVDCFTQQVETLDGDCLGSPIEGPAIDATIAANSGDEDVGMVVAEIARNPDRVVAAPPFCTVR